MFISFTCWVSNEDILNPEGYVWTLTPIKDWWLAFWGNHHRRPAKNQRMLDISYTWQHSPHFGVSSPATRSSLSTNPNYCQECHISLEEANLTPCVPNLVQYRPISQVCPNLESTHLSPQKKMWRAGIQLQWQCHLIQLKSAISNRTITPKHQ
jgi:hypothetical protein